VAIALPLLLRWRPIPFLAHADDAREGEATGDDVIVGEGEGHADGEGEGWCSYSYPLRVAWPGDYCQLRTPAVLITPAQPASHRASPQGARRCASRWHWRRRPGAARARRGTVVAPSWRGRGRARSGRGRASSRRALRLNLQHDPPLHSASRARVADLASTVGAGRGGARVCAAVPRQQRYGPSPPGAFERPQRFPMGINFVWGFCLGAQGA
jgi:hypothetical protein